MRVRPALAVLSSLTVAVSLLVPSVALADAAGVSPDDPAPPTVVELGGTLRVVPFEHPAVVVEPGESVPEGEIASGDPTVTLVTDSGAEVDLRGAQVHDAVSGTRFDGTVRVPAAVARSVSDEVVLKSLTLDETGTGDLVADLAADMDAPLSIVTATLTPPTAPLAAPKPHTVELMYLYRSGAAPSVAAIQAAAVTRLGEYWTSQSNGQISTVTQSGATIVRAVSRATLPDLCDQFAVWDYASSASGFGRGDQYYWAGTSSAHLIVMVPDTECGGGGLGTLGASIHTGGLVWASVKPTVPTEWDQTLFHEVGHNLGLGHSNQRACNSATVVDAPVDAASGYPGWQCADYEYYDLYDVMGMGFTMNGLITTNANVPALNVTQKVKLDALPRGSALQTATIDGGEVQQWTLLSAGGSVGTRGLEVIDPKNGERIYVEYRSGTQRDARSLYSRWESVVGDEEFHPGVRILRMFDRSDTESGPFSAAASRRTNAFAPSLPYYRDGNAFVMWFGPGMTWSSHSTTPNSTSGVTIEVVGTTTETADVRVTFNDGWNTKATPVVSAPGGSAHWGEVLTATGASVGAWMPAPSSVSYQWLRGSTPIAGATTATYQITGADVNAPISVRATATAPWLPAAPRTSAAIVPAGPAQVARHAGATRYEVAVNVSKDAFPTTAPVVFVATGLNYPDALSAAPVAADAGGPLLLVPTAGVVPAAVLERIAELNPDDIVIVGGTGSVSEEVAAQVQAAAPAAKVDRRGGANRYEASRNLIDAHWADGETVPSVYIATGRSYPDALSAAPVAGSKGVPVLLVDGVFSTLDDETVGLLARLDPADVYIAGGPGSVSTGIEAQLGRLGYAVTRYGGADRYEASAAVNAGSFTGDALPQAYFASGLAFADALSGAVLAGVRDAPLFVVRQTCVPRSAASMMGAKAAASVTLVGGPATLTREVELLTVCP